MPSTFGVKPSRTSQNAVAIRRRVLNLVGAEGAVFNPELHVLGEEILRKSVQQLDSVDAAPTCAGVPTRTGRVPGDAVQAVVGRATADRRIHIAADGIAKLVQDRVDESNLCTECGVDLRHEPGISGSHSAAGPLITFAMPLTKQLVQLFALASPATSGTPRPTWPSLTDVGLRLTWSAGTVPRPE